MGKLKFNIVLGMILAAAFSRLIPHPPNFTPLAAMAIFGGAKFADKKQAFLIPLFVLLLSDWVIGFYPLMPIIYALFMVSVWLGRMLKKQESPQQTVLVVLLNSMLFFMVSNFAVWIFGTAYPKTAEGLMLCYVAAIPFFERSLVGDAFYASALFGIYSLAAAWIAKADLSRHPSPKYSRKDSASGSS